MAFTLTQVASLTWRDYVTDGVPSSGKHSVAKSEVRTWGGEIENYLNGTSDLDQISITGGTIDGAPIGATTPAAGTFTTLDATGNVAFDDDLFFIENEADNTKRLRFQLAGLTTATTRTLTVPDANDTLALVTLAQTLTNKTLTSPIINTPTINGATVSGTFSGALTLSGSVTFSQVHTVESIAPARDLKETDGTTTHNVVREIVNGDLFTRQTLDNSKSFVSTDFQETRTASGVSNHLWNVNGGFGAELTVSGIELVGGIQLTERSSEGHVGAAGKGEIWNNNNVATFTDDNGVRWNLQDNGAKVKLATKTPSGAASVDFTSADGIDNATYTSYVIDVDGLLPSTDGVDLYLRTSTDNGVSFDSGASDYKYQVFESIGSATSAEGATSAEIRLTRSEVGNAAGEYGWFGEIHIKNAGATARKRITFSGGYDRSASGLVHVSGVGYRDAAAAVNAFQLLFASGNLTGTVILYGVK